MNFEPFESLPATAGEGQILQALVTAMRDQQQYSAWFEALKMQARWELGLEPWNPGHTEPLSPDVQRKLEDRLVAACQLVGEHMISAGRIAEGWMYLRPVGDSQRAAQLLHSIEPDDANVEQLIEVAIGHGVSPAWGYRLLLERMGVCNAITAFDSQMVAAPLDQRQAAAALLVQRLHHELVDSVRHHYKKIRGLDPAAPGEGDDMDLPALLAAAPELLAGQNYHVDTSHLSSVVRIGRIVDRPDIQQLALQLIEYGAELAEMFQPRGYPVFDPFYQAHRHYYQILLGGSEVDAGLEFFTQRRRTLTSAAEEPSVMSLEGQIESTDVLVELLMRIGRSVEASQVLLEQLRWCGEHQRSRWTALLFACCQNLGDFQALRDYSREIGDGFGFGLATLYQQRTASRQ